MPLIDTHGSAADGGRTTMVGRRKRKKRNRHHPARRAKGKNRNFEPY